MASRASNFCIDAADPYAQTMWWAQVLEDFRVDDSWEMQPGDEECGLVGPDDRFLLFLKVPEPKTVKNRMHVCLRPTDRSRDEEIDRIVGLGATLVNDLRQGEKGWAVLADPEGNEFCVLTPYRPSADPDDGSGDGTGGE
jgi:glyoxalase superfamily protein